MKRAMKGERLPAVTPSPKRRKDGSEEEIDELELPRNERDDQPSARRNILRRLEEPEKHSFIESIKAENEIWVQHANISSIQGEWLLGQQESEEEYESISCERSEREELPETQEPMYTQDVQAGVDNNVERYALLEDAHAKGIPPIPVADRTFCIGRDPRKCQLITRDVRVGRMHCKLHFHGDGTCTLTAEKSCWILDSTDTEWKKVVPNQSVILVSEQHLRLIPPGKSNDANPAGIEYRLYITSRKIAAFGSQSFDFQYLSLLRAIQAEGELQTNKKGSNRTLRRSFHFTIDLSDEQDRNILPITSLRNLYGGRAALIEAIWYLRGEDNVRFLQENKNHFWDKQCKEDGWLGLNYGLLTNYPQGEGKGSINQLEDIVLTRLCKGEKSRNMTCSLLKPGESTEQVACTSSIQFSVSQNDRGDEALDLTVNQRSSDVIVGLPHDVVIWSIILHLVRREVRIRTIGKRKLAAGNLIFAIAGGGAHVYTTNMDAFETLLKREPEGGPQPYLQIGNGDDGNNDSGRTSREDNEPLETLVHQFDGKKFRIRDYQKFHPRIEVIQAV